MSAAVGRTGTGVVAALVVALLASGCGAEEKAADAAESAGEKAIEKAVAEGEHGDQVEDVDVDADAGTVRIKGKDGTLLLGEDLPMPEEFPATLPLPEGGHSVNAVVAEKGVFEVTMFVTDTDLVAHEKRIREGLEQSGYEIGTTENTTVDGIPQRVVNGVGHDTDVAVRFSEPMGKAAVHYSVKPTG